MTSTTASHRTAHPPGARALNLGGGGHKRVTHTHEALVVTNAIGQTLRYPLARLARIVSSPAVDWNGAALSLCLQNGISITWADGKGQPLGSACPTRAKHIGQAATLELLLEQPGGTEHYANWHRSRRMAVLARWSQTSPTPVSPLLWEMAKREWAYLRNPAAHIHLPQPLQTLMHAWVVAQLLAHPLPTLLWDAQGDDIPLAQDLTELLWVEMNLCSGPLANNTNTGTGTERELTELFERWHAPNGAALHQHIGALLRVAKSSQYP
jgi:hypothetical protein